MIAFSGQGLVPVLVDGDQEVHESWEIACYLEDKYLVNPLFGSAQARSIAFVFKIWVESAIQLPILRAIVVDLFAALH